ncbi:MAG: hypothetical protein LKF70_10325 [Prevotella sp.]|nr:hypothetical protein [Prevotella sp.]MCH4242533.1 hypothetical protein [Prevotella sp.]
MEFPVFPEQCRSYYVRNRLIYNPILTAPLGIGIVFLMSGKRSSIKCPALRFDNRVSP